MIDEKTEKKILEFIAGSKEPIHSTDISKLLEINRVTVTKYLSVLHSKGLVRFKNVGMAKVWLPIENPVLRAFEANDSGNMLIRAFNSLPDGISVLDKEMEIVWLNKEMEKRHGRLEKLLGKKCFKTFHNREEACQNCPTEKTFQTGKNSKAEIKKKGYRIEISTAPLKDKAGKTVAVIETVRIRKTK